MLWRNNQRYCPFIVTPRFDCRVYLPLWKEIQRRWARLSHTLPPKKPLNSAQLEKGSCDKTVKWTLVLPGDLYPQGSLWSPQCLVYVDVSHSRWRLYEVSHSLFMTAPLLTLGDWKQAAHKSEHHGCDTRHSHSLHLHSLFARRVSLEPQWPKYLIARRHSCSDQYSDARSKICSMSALVIQNACLKSLFPIDMNGSVINSFQAYIILKKNTHRRNLIRGI